jgi:hypothetical protein
MASTDKTAEALKIIKPDPSRKADCERDLTKAFVLIETETKAGPSPAKRIKQLQSLARKLRRDLDHAEALDLSPQTTDSLKCCLQEIENTTAHIRKYELTKGAPRHNEARAAAVKQAAGLLEKYGQQPTLYWNGNWRKLSQVLIGNEQADLLDHMRAHYAADRIYKILGGADFVKEHFNDALAKALGLVC